MSDKTDALEQAVLAVIQARGQAEAQPGRRAQAEVDRAFARVLKLAAPRIRHFIAQYGLGDHREDAEQVCAIAVHRAIESYDPDKAKFTTFVNWQLRGELQSLRFRLRTDQRSSAKKVQATTIALDALANADGEGFAALIEDEDALARAERGAADVMAANMARVLIDTHFEQRRRMALGRAGATRTVVRRRGDDEVRADLPRIVHCKPGTVHPAELARIEAKLARDRQIVERYLAAADDDAGEPADALTRERQRQIGRRACREIAMLGRAMPALASERAPRRTAPVMVEAIEDDMGLTPVRAATTRGLRLH